MKNLMVTLALVVGLLSTSVSFAESAFDGLKTTELSKEDLEKSGEGIKLSAPALVPYVMDAARTAGGYACALRGGTSCQPNYQTKAFRAADNVGRRFGQ